MKYLLGLLLLFSVGCVSSGVKKEEADSKADAVSLDEGSVSITLPSSNAKNLTRSPFLNTQKSEIFSQQGIKVFFYYGIGGRYLVQVVLPETISLDFTRGEGTLLVDYSGSSPETLSLESSREGLFQGQGNLRNGKTDFRLELSAPAPNGAFFKKEFEFSIHIYDNLSLVE